MATKRLSMRQTREILRQRLFLQRSYREIGRQPGPQRGRGGDRGTPGAGRGPGLAGGRGAE